MQVWSGLEGMLEVFTGLDRAIVLGLDACQVLVQPTGDGPSLMLTCGPRPQALVEILCPFQKNPAWTQLDRTLQDAKGPPQVFRRAPAPLEGLGQAEGLLHVPGLEVV